MSTATRPWLFDTNVYVAALREGLGGHTFARLVESAPRTYLSAVVSAELHAGARDQAGRRAVLGLGRRFARLGRIVVPTATSWDAAGDVMAMIVRRAPGLRSKIRGLWNDALIALSARQIGATLVTADVEDYTLIRSYVRFSFEAAPGGRI
jgi:predicted nucleic acid-binding protein